MNQLLPHSYVQNISLDIAGLVSNIFFRYLASVASFFAMPFNFMRSNNTVGKICVPKTT
jgi:hypothetical protein